MAPGTAALAVSRTVPAMVPGSWRLTSNVAVSPALPVRKRRSVASSWTGASGYHSPSRGLPVGGSTPTEVKEPYRSPNGALYMGTGADHVPSEADVAVVVTEVPPGSRLTTVMAAPATGAPLPSRTVPMAVLNTPVWAAAGATWGSGAVASRAPSSRVAARATTAVGRRPEDVGAVAARLLATGVPPLAPRHRVDRCASPGQPSRPLRCGTCRCRSVVPVLDAMRRRSLRSWRAR